MYCVELNKTINQITSLFYLLGLWHQGEEPTVRETRLKIFYSIYYLLFPVSLLAGSIKSDNKHESIFLLKMTIMSAVTSLKLFYIILKKRQILELLNRICVYSLNDREDFTYVNDKLKIFMKFIYFIIVPVSLTALSTVLVIPCLGSEKKLFFAIGFPLDYKHDETAYWIANTFIFTQIILSIVAYLFSPVVWYIMINCWLKYDILGNRIRQMGKIEIIETTDTQKKISKLEHILENIFCEVLIEAVEFHQRIKEDIQQMTSFLSIKFMAQLATSGLCICGSIYSLLFNINDNLMEYFIYLISLFLNVFEIFMIMYFGNEIKFSSDRLTYCLFESNWPDQPPSTKKLLLIFGEMIKRPYVLVIAKIYPVTLETFTRILNSAYSMFNVLKNLK